MSTDQMIAGDLAALAADNQIRIPALDVALRTRVPAPAVAPTGIEVAVLAAAHVYARRFARTAAGAAALVCALALVAWLSNPLGLSTDMSRIGSELEQYIVYVGPLEVVPWLALAVVVTSLVARRLADRRVARWLAASPDPLADIRARARALSGLATGLRIAGPAALAITLAMDVFANGLDAYSTFWTPDDPVLGPVRVEIMAAMLATLLAAAIIGVGQARAACMTERLAHPLVTGLGVALGLATLIAGARLDVGPHFVWFVKFAGVPMPSTALRIALTITGSLAVLLVVASCALRRDHREQRSLR